MMLGSSQNERILDDEDNPHSTWTMKTITTPLCRYRPRAGSEDDVPLQSMDESGRGPRKAVAEAVASPLGVQPSINSDGVSSSNMPAARDDAAEATPSARCYVRVPL
jgi:hypothetical protein